MMMIFLQRIELINRKIKQAWFDGKNETFKLFLVEFHWLNFEAIGKKLKESDKPESHNMLSSFTNAKFDNFGSITNSHLKNNQGNSANSWNEHNKSSKK